MLYEEPYMNSSPGITRFKKQILLVQDKHSPWCSLDQRDFGFDIPLCAELFWRNIRMYQHFHNIKMTHVANDDEHNDTPFYVVNTMAIKSSIAHDNSVGTFLPEYSSPINQRVELCLRETLCLSKFPNSFLFIMYYILPYTIVLSSDWTSCAAVK